MPLIEVMEELKAKELYEMFYFAPDEDGVHSQNKYRAKVQASSCCSVVLGTLDFDTEKIIFWRKVMRCISKI